MKGRRPSEKRGSDRRERIRIKNVRNHTKKASLELNDILSSLKKDVSNFAEKTKDVPNEPITEGKNNNSSHQTSLGNVLLSRKSSHILRQDKDARYKERIAHAHSAKQITTMEENHLCDKLRRKEYEAVDFYLKDLTERKGHHRRHRSGSGITTGSGSSRILGSSESMSSMMDSHCTSSGGMIFVNGDEVFHCFADSATEICLVLRNTRLKAWPESTSLQANGGDMKDVAKSIHVGAVAPGQDIEVNLSLRTPGNNRHGKMFHYFKLISKEEETFSKSRSIGSLLTVSFDVRGVRLASSGRHAEQGQQLWRAACPDSPSSSYTNRKKIMAVGNGTSQKNETLEELEKRERKERREQRSQWLKDDTDVQKIDRAFGSEDNSNRGLPGLVQIPGMPMHFAGVDRMIAQREQQQNSRK